MDRAYFFFFGFGLVFGLVLPFSMRINMEIPPQDDRPCCKTELPKKSNWSMVFRKVVSVSAEVWNRV